MLVPAVADGCAQQPLPPAPAVGIPQALAAPHPARTAPRPPQFADVTGGCERILRTPVPLMYTRHNSRMLAVWLTLLPFT